MYDNKTIIDVDGNIVEKCVLFKDGEPQYFKLKNGQQAIDYLNKTQIINNRTVEYLNPKWDGSKWIETATEEELNKTYPVLIPKPVAITESLQQQLLKTQNIIINMKYQQLLNNK